MAKTFHERFQAMMGPCPRVSDLRDLIAESGAMIEEATDAHAAAKAKSIDPASTPKEALDAHEEAGRQAFEIERLQVANEQLAERLERLEESEATKRRTTECGAAIAERDDLAAEFEATVQSLLVSLPDLFARVEANEKRLKRAGLREPNAEAKARSLKGGQYGIDWFSQMKIPAWSGKGRSWPPKSGNPDPGRASIVAAHQTIAADRAAEMESRWGRYRIATEDVIGGLSFKARVEESNAGRVVTIYDKDWEGQITHVEAVRLRKLGAIVEPLDPVDGGTAPANDQPEFSA